VAKVTRQTVRSKPYVVKADVAPRARPVASRAPDFEPGSAPVARAENTPPPAPRAAQMHYVKVPGALAEILLPATGATPEASFRQWAKKLEHVDAFGDQRPQVKELTQLTPTKGDAGDRDDRPRIGIMIHHAKAVAHERTDVKRFIEAVERAGCRAVLIPPLAELALPDDPIARQQALAGMVGQLDGLIAPGGPDIHPRLYHERFNGADRDTVNYPRDLFEAQLLGAARDENLFTLGICRGNQLINVVGGSHLVQDTVKAGLTSYSHYQLAYKEPESQVEHVDGHDHVVLARGELEDIIGTDHVATNSLHHQVVEKAAADLQVVGVVHDATTGKDTIEATRKWNLLAVQFHPEYRPDAPESKAIFDTLKRAWAFFLADQLRKEGATPTVDAIAQRLLKHGISLAAADAHWLTTDFAEHLKP
jgi:putative glutamine amidotransferase